MIFFLLIKIASDGGPSPNTLVAITNTLIPVEGEHNNDETSNMWLQTPPPQEEAEMLAEPQLLPEVESE